jgi:nucleotide-binding universal stress UspA family protein
VKKILVALDGSKHSKKAVELAVDISRIWNAEVYLIHVMEKKNIPPEFGEYAKSEQVEPSNYFSWVAEKILNEAESRFRDIGIEKIECLYEIGNPADKIIEEAHKKNVDLIIMGSRGLGSFSRTFMGSVSTKVCHHARASCIAVK